MTEPIAYDVPSAAEAVGVSSDVIRAAYTSGDLIASRVGRTGRKVIIHRDELDAWVRALPHHQRTA